jgi:hypothetical protein
MHFTNFFISKIKTYFTSSLCRLWLIDVQYEATLCRFMFLLFVCFFERNSSLDMARRIDEYIRFWATKGSFGSLDGAVGSLTWVMEGNYKLHGGSSTGKNVCVPT